ncbi:MAG: hypothetical protein ACYCYI_11460 [Saccharofermentanales bacterium]
MAIAGLLKYKSSIYLPATWSSKSSNQIYNHRDIIADNIITGECRVNVNAFLEWLDWTTVKEISSNEKTQIYSMQVKYKNLSVDIYRAVYYNQTCSTCIVLDIRQDAMKLDQFLKLAGFIKTKYDLSANKAGLTDYSTSPAKILVLGNSFVGSSEIQSVFSEIAAANKKNLSIEAESIGYATVETFTGNNDIMDRLKNNGYDFLFLCGFYQNSETAYETLMKEKAAVTKIVIFPAHNESPLLPYEQFFKRPEAGIADWKGFIELLIEDGMDKSRLCINDQHLHSTNLAGYAGACLIYSYLYKSKPIAGTVEEIIAMDQQRLGFDHEESIRFMSEIRQKAYNYLYDIS